MTFTALLQPVGYGFTVHEFHSTSRDWAAEWMPFPRKVHEAALAHVAERGATEVPRLRSDLSEKQRQLMEARAFHCKMEMLETWTTPVRTILLHK
ncbi:integrase [Noviherbaspirillum pedocola]|uniref:Integrase n=1 Tax=Noviherbaspirillum pedocola TaxID=2801341 RepID=A0A934SWP9_9BURK|nr:integrase [Noviherbaspirillum pedocola]MBK4734222.1 integrase [Noviherbaspirillum pedocola]